MTRHVTHTSFQPGHQMSIEAKARRKATMQARRESYGAYRRRWREPGTRRIKNGYIILKLNTGWVAEHRHVASLLLGRALVRNEHVHHINHDRADNRPENLIVMTASTHKLHHLSEYRARSWTCTMCSTSNKPHCAKGLCKPCYYRLRRQLQGSGNYLRTPPT